MTPPFGRRFNVHAIPRVGDAVRRIYGENLDFSLVAPELQLAHVLENDRAEQWWQHGTIPWTTDLLTIAAAIGNIGAIGVKNESDVKAPVLSVVVGAVVIAKASAGPVTVVYDSVGQVTANNGQAFATDTRQPGLKVTTTTFISNALAAKSGREVDRITTAAGADARFGGRDANYPLAIITPGHSFNILNLTANEVLSGFLFGYERQARTDELTR